MKSKFLLTVGFLVGSSAAFAADMPARVVKPGPVIAPACFWAGGYVGGHAGYTWTQSKYATATLNNPAILLPNTTVPGVSQDQGKITGGAYGGYNFCLTPSFIVGLEADVTKFGNHTKTEYVTGGYGFGKGYDANWGGSLRLRAGLTFDRFMVYGTGGLAVVDHSAYSVIRNLGTGVNVGGRKSETSVGYVVGAGLEYAITPNLLGRVEYLYTDTGSLTTPIGSKVDSKLHTVRVGVAYKF